VSGGRRDTFAIMSGDTRIGPEQRTEVISLLGRALDEGLLPIEEYDARIAEVGSAVHASQLQHELADLPDSYAWGPADLPEFGEEAPFAAAPPSTAGRTALILGLLSIPLAFCVIGGLVGAAAVVMSFRAPRPAPDARRSSAALAGRVFGVVGVVLAIVVVIVVEIARHASFGP
jgi:hypothetical protein